MSIPEEFKRFPSHWNVLPFTQAIKDATSGNVKIKRGEYLDDGKIPVVDQGQLLYGGFTNDKGSICKSKLPTIVFGDHTREFKYVNQPFALGADGAKILEPLASLNKRFLFHYLKQLRIESAGYSRHYKFLKETYVPIPPLTEQKRIAAILDKADAIRRKRQQGMTLADEFLRSVFLEMFGDPALNPKLFHELPLGQLKKEKMNNGIFKKNDEYGGQMPVAWVGELFRGSKISFLPEGNYFDPSEKELKSYGLKYGDILFCRSSLKLEGIGFNNVFLGKDYSALFECHLIRMSPDLSKVDPVFLNYQLRMPNIRKRVFQQSKTVTMTTIDQDGLSKVLVLCPPLSLQNEFKRIYLKVSSVIEDIGSLKPLDRSLFDSLSQKAFNGEL